MKAAAIAFVIVALVGACGKQRDDGDGDGVAGSSAPARLVIPAAEIQRGQDACNAYVERVCACGKTVPAAASACELARALPDAVRIGGEVAASADSSRLDVLHAQDSIRKTTAECIEQTAKLPTLGCN